MADDKEKQEKGYKPFYQKWWFYVIIAVVIVGIFGDTSDDEVADEEDDDNGEEVEDEPEETVEGDIDEAVEEDDESEEEENRTDESDNGEGDYFIGMDEVQYDDENDLISVFGTTNLTEIIGDEQYDPFVTLHDENDDIISVHYGQAESDDMDSFFSNLPNIEDGNYSVQTHFSCLSMYEHIHDEFGYRCEDLQDLDVENEVTEFGYVPDTYAIVDQYQFEMDEGLDGESYEERANFLLDELAFTFEILTETINEIGATGINDDLVNMMDYDMVYASFLIQSLENTDPDPEYEEAHTLLPELREMIDEAFTLMGESLDETDGDTMEESGDLLIDASEILTEYEEQTGLGY